MKRALIVSDTHGREENLERVLAEIGMPDALIHLGDSEGGEDTIPMLGHLSGLYGGRKL